MNEVKMPRLGVTMQKGTISNWLIDEGESVEKGDYLFELETEKSTLEVEAQTTGILRKIIVQTGEEVPINTVIAIIADENEELDLSAHTTEQPDTNINQARIEQAAKEEQTSQVLTKPRRTQISPRARKLAKEKGINIEEISGTGKDGLITEEDIKNAATDKPSLSIKEKIKLNNIRRSMAENMLDSWNTIPQFTQMVSVNMTQVLKVKKETQGVSLNDILLKSVAMAVEASPIVNSKLDEDEIIVYDEVNISLAVNSPHGLVVPVIRGVEQKSVQDISMNVKELARKAESNQLSMDDYSNGTITVSNLGNMGIESGTPIINAPQSTIVFIGEVRKSPIVNENDEIIVAPMMTLSICFDHRFIDGVTGARFTNELKNVLENLSVNDLL